MKYMKYNMSYLNFNVILLFLLIDLVQLGALSAKHASRIEQYARCVQNTYLSMKADNEKMQVGSSENVQKCSTYCTQLKKNQIVDNKQSVYATW